jgi:transcriptional regulator with XRE-family HTH domain
MPASVLIRTARQAAGLTQAQLATNARMPQSAIARLEAPGSNPTVKTLERVLEAAGRGLDTRPRAAAGVDESLIEQNLALSPSERLAAFRRSYDNVRRTIAKATPAGGRVA